MHKKEIYIKWENLEVEVKKILENVKKRGWVGIVSKNSDGREWTNLEIK